MKHSDRNIPATTDRNISGNREVSMTTIETSNDVAQKIKEKGFGKLNLLELAMERLHKILTAPMVDITKMEPAGQRIAWKEFNDSQTKAIAMTFNLAKIVSASDHRTTRHDTTENVSVEIEKVVGDIIGELSPKSRLEISEALSKRLEDEEDV